MQRAKELIASGEADFDVEDADGEGEDGEGLELLEPRATKEVHTN